MRLDAYKIVALASRLRAVSVLTDDLALRNALEARGMVVVGCGGEGNKGEWEFGGRSDGGRRSVGIGA